MKILNWLLPAPCLVCGAPESGGLRLCPGCLTSLSRIMNPCIGCGAPLASPGSCLECIARPPRFIKRSVYRYNETAAALVAALKGKGLYPLAEPLARISLQDDAEAEALRLWTSEADLLTPVPSHFIRRFQRGYNPAGLLAAALARQTGASLASGLLRRRRWQRQTGQSGAARRRIGRAFAPGLWRGAAKGRTILLIDDVDTTGATLRAAALELLRLGAKEVRALAFFRVVDSFD